MFFQRIVIPLALLCVIPSASATLDPLVSYDDFSVATLSPDRWSTFERSREIKKGALSMVMREWGATDNNSSVSSATFSTPLLGSGGITQLKATIMVNSFQVTGCAGNPKASAVRVRLNGAFFSTAPTVPVGKAGDVLAQVRLSRYSSSSAPATQMTAEGAVSICQNDDCSVATPLAPTVTLGAVDISQPNALAIEWDKPNKRFRFVVNEGQFEGFANYTVADGSAPSSSSKQLGIRTELASCSNGVRTSGLIDATFDDVQVNKSAQP